MRLVRELGTSRNPLASRFSSASRSVGSTWVISLSLLISLVTGLTRGWRPRSSAPRCSSRVSASDAHRKLAAPPEPRSYLLLYREDHSVLCGSGHGRGGALMLRRLSQQHAAVNDELRAGREAGLVGGDEQHQAGDLVRLGHARNRQTPCLRRYGRRGVRPARHRRADWAGVGGVDAD